MDNSESEDLLRLELLPIEVITVIASYLKVRDVVQCCATSSTMRELFSDNSIWRPYCKRELAENLKKTPNKVFPIFVTPTIDETSLSPLPEWRISFMRENHLWNNWRKGLFTREFIKQRHPSANFHMFYNSNCVIAKCQDRIKFLDVSVIPASDICTLPLENLPFDAKEGCYPKIDFANGLILFLLYSCVQVFELDLNTKVCELKHAFFFERSLASKISDVNGKKSIDDGPTLKLNEKHVIVGNLFVGILEKESTMHIWNLETGQKVKEEPCILKNCSVLNIKSSDTMHMILRVGKVNEKVSTLLAYSLQKMKYLPFKETQDMISEYSVHKDFVVIKVKTGFQIFNYQTSTITQTISADTFPKSLKNNLFFIKDEDIQVFNPITNTTKALGLRSVQRFEILGDKFLQVGRSRAIWEIDKSCQHIKKTHMKFPFDCCGFFLNKAYTSYIVRFDVGYILNFW